MTRSERLLREAVARARVVEHLRQLEGEVNAGTLRRHLEVRAELIELLLERTGDNHYTTEYRERLALQRQRIEQRPHLQLIRGLS